MATTSERHLDAENGDEMSNAAAVTLVLLESRLRAIEYALYGHMDGTAANGSKDKSAATRLRELEVGLEHYTAKTKVILDLLKLREFHDRSKPQPSLTRCSDAQSPDLFQNADEGEVPSLLDTESKAAIVLASATSYPLTASSLTSILDTPIPAAELSAKVMATGPQIEQLAALQNSQLKTMAALKERTSQVLQRWYSVDILQSGEYWADVEARVDTVEQTVRRATQARQQDV